MLNPNSRANTVISQSFIASQFQGYNDPFTKAEPTSSLNQFVRSKQTSDSGFIQDGQNQAFGFGNITSGYEPNRLESVSRKADQVVQINISTPSQQQLKSQSTYQPEQYYNQQKQFIQPPQPQANERYVSPNIVKADSPTKMNQFPPKVAVYPKQMMTTYQTSQTTYTQQQSMTTNDSLYRASNQPQSPSYSKNESFSNQYSLQQLNGSQLSGSRPSTTQQNLEGSSVGKRLKLNVSQEFSNSFVLKCVNEPQKSSILQMKQRQREYRKSIQNFFV